MRFDFLAASDGTPLAKQFSRDSEGRVDVEQYPPVLRFTSTAEHCESLDDLLLALRKHAAAHACVLKGHLARPLTNERRAGSTETNDHTSWILLDIDRTDGVSSHEQFVSKCLPAELHDVDYIWQPSSSALAQPERGLSGHLFMLLKDDVPAPLLRAWLVHQNLTNKVLRSALQLSQTGKSLKYTLDVTTCQNDKLIYIAPPLCNYEVDTSSQFTLIRKGHRTAKIDFEGINDTANREASRETVVELRKAAGLPATKGDNPKVKFYKDMELLENPDPALVTGVRQGDDFVYLNINGGDSWGYFHKNEDPCFLFNFKGEPTVRLADFVPEYWKFIQSLQAEKKQGTLYLGVWHRESDSYYTLEFDRATEALSLCRTRSKDRIKDFMEANGRSAPMPPPIFQIAFEPQNSTVVDIERQFINRYSQTTYMREAGKASELPPICREVLYHAFNHDQQCIDHFLNWLAFIYQYRRKTMTAWVLQGTEGTGKGLLFNKIIRPTLGHNYCYETMISQLSDPFNGWKEENLLTLVDESDVGGDSKKRALVNMFKNNITEEQLVIRRMNTDPYEAPSFMNFIFSSNEHYAVYFTANDRRYNVAPRQEKMLEMTDEKVAAISRELQDWTNFMMSFEVNCDAVRKPLRNAAKTDLMEAAKNSVDRFFDAVRDGDTAYFYEAYVDSPPASWSMHYAQYKEVFERWTGGSPDAGRVASSELIIAYQYINRQRIDINPNKFGRMMSLRGLKSETMRIDGTVKRGIEVEWDALPDYSNIVSLTGTQ